MLEKGTIITCSCGTDLFEFKKAVPKPEKVRVILANGNLAPIAPQPAPVANEKYRCHNCQRLLTPMDIVCLNRRGPR